MAATIQINRIYGSGAGTAVDITSINSRMNAYDGHSTADTSYPIRIPTSGSNYSYWCTIRLNCTATPSGTINNIRAYTDGANSLGTGVTMKWAKASTGTNAGYRQATGASGSAQNLRKSITPDSMERRLMRLLTRLRHR